MEATLRKVEEVIGAMDFGAHTTFSLMRAFPDIPQRTLEEYRSRAHKRIAQDSAERRNNRRAHALNREYGFLRQLVVERDSAKDAKERSLIDHAISRVQDRIAKTEGTYAPEKIEVVEREGWQELTAAELKSIKETGRLPDGRRAEDLDRMG